MLWRYGVCLSEQRSINKHMKVGVTEFIRPLASPNYGECREITDAQFIEYGHWVVKMKRLSQFIIWEAAGCVQIEVKARTEKYLSGKPTPICSTGEGAGAGRPSQQMFLPERVCLSLVPVTGTLQHPVVAYQAVKAHRVVRRLGSHIF